MPRGATPTAIVVAALLHAAPAPADGLDLPGASARQVARAGAGLIAVDDPASLWLDPAALARRGGRRVTLGVALADAEAAFSSDAVFANGTAPTVQDRAGVDTIAWGGAALGLGDTFVVGAVVLTPSNRELAFPAPPTSGIDPMHDDSAVFPARYAGSRTRLRRTAAGVGLAWRASPWLAVGAAGFAVRVSADQDRTLWAGDPAAAATLGGLSPAYDMPLFLSAEATVPAASAGVVIAPVDAPIELGLSVLWCADATLLGIPALGPARNPSLATPLIAPGAGARLTLSLPTTFHAGARFLFPRGAIELDAELSRVRPAAATWSLPGVGADTASGRTMLPAVPFGAVFEDGYALRASAEAVVVPGAVTATLGYAYTRAPLAAVDTAPSLFLGDAHTLAAGIEGHSGAATVVIGVAHTFRTTRDGPAGATVIDPLGPTQVPAANGRLAGGDTLVALDLELAL